MTAAGIPFDILEQLRLVVGPDDILTDAEARDRYGRDETEDYVFPPDVILRPHTAAQVASILRIANTHGIPVTPRGGGTGLSGGALPVERGILLSMERFDRIREIDQANLQAVVEPGVITQKFQEAVESLGLFYPPDPASRGSCTIGGNLAECAGGPRAVKYGVTKDYVLDVEAVLPSGEIINTGARVLKNVTGYNLTQLLIGSEGTLAVITAVAVRLLPLPKSRRVLLVAFDSLESAARAVTEIFQAGITPAALEFMERAAVAIAEERLSRKFPNGQAGAQLFIELDGNYDDAVMRDVEATAAVLERHSPIDITVAEGRVKMEEVWSLRRGIGEAVKSISAYKEEDTVVPRNKLPELVRGVKEICARYDVTSICYGHAGDGNVHVNLLKGTLDDRRWTANAHSAIHEIFTLALSLGGTISGEHGIGYSQKPYMPLAVSPQAMKLMRGIKALFDPKGILNPGKIFP